VIPCDDDPTTIEAAKFMLEFVGPRLSKNDKHRPYTYYFCDSLYTLAGSTKKDLELLQSMKTTAAGIAGFITKNEEERKEWAGRILANAVVDKFLGAYEVELEDFYAITNEGSTSSPYGAYVNNRLGLFIPPGHLATLYDLGFVDYGVITFFSTYVRLYNPTAVEDVEDFLARCYAFTDEEIEAKFGTYDKITRKFKIMQELFERFKDEVLEEN